MSSFQFGAARIRNAASSELYGLKGQFRLRGSEPFQVYGGAAWTHARYTSCTGVPFYSYCDPAVPATDLANSLNCDWERFPQIAAELEDGRADGERAR